MVVIQTNLEEEALIRQWKEYKKVYLDPLDPQNHPLSSTVLQELNNALANKSYFAGHRGTGVDEEILAALYRTYASLPLQSKEKYMHLSRWFNTVQHQVLASDSNNSQRKLISFTRTLLYSEKCH